MKIWRLFIPKEMIDNYARLTAIAETYYKATGSYIALTEANKAKGFFNQKSGSQQIYRISWLQTLLKRRLK